MADEKRAPVQGYAPGIPWAMHLRAYEAYCKYWKFDQPALIDLEGRNCRGGFSVDELDDFIPGWRKKLQQGGGQMTEEQIRHMVNRFLAWRLPENFNPDGGISFKKTFNEHTAHPMKHEPTGTNLFGADQADVMVRHMLEGLPDRGES